MTARSDSNTFGGHRKRIRARLELDPLAVADYEILELLLGLALTRKDTKPLAYSLLERFGNIRGVLDARPDELLQVNGFGHGLIALWQLIREVMTRYAQAPLVHRISLASPEAVATVARTRLANLPHEECWLALVDAQNHLVAWERLRKGGISSVAVQPRDVLELAFARKASGIILIHNHPGGNPRPSRADLDLTDALKNLAPQLGLRLLDHMIITPGECYSILLGQTIRPPEVK